MINCLPQHCACETCRQASTTIETLTKINAELYKLVETQIGKIQISLMTEPKQIELMKGDYATHLAHAASSMAWGMLAERLTKHVDLFKRIDDLKVQLLLRKY